MDAGANQVTFDIGQKEPNEFLTELHEAIAELKKFAFSHPSVELDKGECHSMFVLSDFQIKVVAAMGN